MKVGLVSRTNEKGQLVIPKKVRQLLGIKSNSLLNLVLRGGGLYIYPVEEVLVKGETENFYLKILEKTQGGWAREDLSSLRKRRKKIELDASKKRRTKW